MKIVKYTLIPALLLSLSLSPSALTARADDERGGWEERFEAQLNTALYDDQEEDDLLYGEVPVENFRVSELSPEVKTDLDYTDWWYSKWEDCHYIFLPATADRKNLVLSYSSDEPLYLDGKEVISGKMTDVLSTKDSFEVTLGETYCGELKIMQSDAGCIYLSTSSGGTDALDANRSLTETGSALILNSEGGTEYSGAIEKLTARGNSSWDYSLKKPYNLKLPKKADLFGMGKAKKWALLSNYLDHSMLRNKVTEEMCREAGMDYVGNSVYVDLYADGSYRGTYQLCERVELKENRVDIHDLEADTEDINDLAPEEYQQMVMGAESPGIYKEDSYKYYDIPKDPADITGGYLMEFQQWNRYGYKCQSGFVTTRGQAIALESPEYASKAQVEYIRNFVQDMEDAIYSDSGFNSKGRHYTDYLDEDSLILAYLAQEISMNVDATSSSFYLWKDSDLTGDGKIHFGPPWDFDLSYNNFYSITSNSEGDIGYSNRYNNLYTVCFPVHGYLEGGRDAVGMSWLSQLYKNKGFVRRAARSYFENYLPALERLYGGEEPLIDRMAEELQPSAEMNNARWHMYGGRPYAPFNSTASGKDFRSSVRLLSDFAKRRYNWLSLNWEEDAKIVRGDINADSDFNLADKVLLQRWLLADPEKFIEDWRSGDLYEDGRLNTIDLCLMKQELLKIYD